jgi:uncharacterized protein YigE (DUF2233 family)
MRPILGCSVALLGVLAACRSHPDGVPSSSTSIAIALSAPSVATAAVPATDAWTSLGKGTSWARQERKDVEGRNTVWGVLRVALSDADVAIVEPSHGRLEQLSKDPAIVGAVNGGFFEVDGAPSGLLISHGRRMAAFNERGGSGLLVMTERRARLVPAEADAAAVLGDVVLQCGPRLVEPDGTLGIRSDDGKRASRTVACIRHGGTELNLVLAWTRNSDRDGPGLFELAQWLRQPLVPGDKAGCEAALNLDGGPSTGVVLRDLPDELHKPYGRVPFAVAITERTAPPHAADR